MKRILHALFVGELSWKRFLRSLVLIPICVLLGLLLIAGFFADQAIFRPPSPSYEDTKDIIKLNTRSGEMISARFFEFPGTHRTILFSHGNAEDIGMISPFASRLRDLGFNVLIFDYQGYGTSGGSPSEENAYADIDAAYEYLVREKETPAGSIFLLGRSLGGGVATDLAHRKKVGGLILESTFTSAFRVVTRYPILPFDKLENFKKIETVSCPILIIHGTNDWTVPSYHGSLLYEKALSSKKALWIEGAGHNDILLKFPDPYFNAIEELVRSNEIHGR